MSRRLENRTFDRHIFFAQMGMYLAKTVVTGLLITLNMSLKEVNATKKLMYSVKFMFIV